MDLAEHHDVTVKLFDFEIVCTGILRADDMNLIGADEHGRVISHSDGATLETTGGTCVNLKTKEKRIFPAGIYRLDKKNGIVKISEIVDE